MALNKFEKMRLEMAITAVRLEKDPNSWWPQLMCSGGSVRLSKEEKVAVCKKMREWRKRGK